MKKIVFLPIETEARELDAKLVLASKVVNKEVTCLVGSTQRTQFFSGPL